MASKHRFETQPSIWRDDIATPLLGSRLVDILVDSRDCYSRPEQIARHLSLSRDEKRLALCAWLRGLLAEGLDGVQIGEVVQTALAELAEFDSGAAAVFRRAFVALGVAQTS